MTKEQIAALITLPDSTLRVLSAQVYNNLSREEKELLREVVVEAGKSYADYQQSMIASFPKAISPPTSTWRR